MKEWLKKHWKAITAFLSAIVVFVGALIGVTSCGSTTRAVIRNGAESTTTTVSITTNNPTNWTVSPDVDLKDKEDQR